MHLKISDSHVLDAKSFTLDCKIFIRAGRMPGRYFSISKVDVRISLTTHAFYPDKFRHSDLRKDRKDVCIYSC